MTCSTDYCSNSLDSTYLNRGVDYVNEPLAREVSHCARQQKETPGEDEHVPEVKRPGNPLCNFVCQRIARMVRACTRNGGRKLTVREKRSETTSGQKGQ